MTPLSPKVSSVAGLPPTDQLDRHPGQKPHRKKVSSRRVTIRWFTLLLAILTGFATGLIFAQLLYEDYIELSARSIHTFVDHFLK